MYTAFQRNPSSLTFTHSYFWNRSRSRGVEGGAGQPQSAVAVRPVLTAAWLPLQPSALITASARIPGQGAAALAVVRGFEGTCPEVTRRALVSPQAPHQKEDANERRGTLAEHGWKEQLRKFPWKNTPLLSGVEPHKTRKFGVSKFFFSLQAIFFFIINITQKSHEDDKKKKNNSDVARKIHGPKAFDARR